MSLKLARALQVSGLSANGAISPRSAKNRLRKAGRQFSRGLGGCWRSGLHHAVELPIGQIALKIAPAMMARCIVVIKHSEIARVNALILAEIIHEGGHSAGRLESSQELRTGVW